MPAVHVPVLLDEVIKYLNPKPGQLYIDCTFGAGGYAKAIEDKIKPNGLVIAFEQDQKAIDVFQKNKQNQNKNIKIIHDNFKNLTKNIQQIYSDLEIFSKPGRIPAKTTVKASQTEENEIRFSQFAGVVFDLGLSSDQLEDRDRGFSFRNDNSPLDMSFWGETENDKVNTYQIVNYYQEKDLYNIIKNYGEERYATLIARNITKTRKGKHLRTVGDLVEIIRKSVPASYTRNKIHFATKTFQALRIATNEELESLEKAIPQAIELLTPGGRLAIVSYHSLEDRIVKQIFKKESHNCICAPDVPQCVCQHKAKIKLITKKPILPSEEEIRINKRARSAKLRVIEKI